MKKAPKKTATTTAARTAYARNEARLRAAARVTHARIDAIGAFMQAADSSDATLKELTAAALLFGAMGPIERSLTLREMWRLIPLTRRRSRLLERARPFAPEGLKWQRAAGGAR